jgi:hypothetical protein
MQVPPWTQPQWARDNTWPKGQKWRGSTKTESGSSIVSTFVFHSIWIWICDPLHWKGYLLAFPWTPRMPQLDVVCDMGICFNGDNSWMSWTLDIWIISAILVEFDFSWSSDRCHWKFYLTLFVCLCRTYKLDFVYTLYINLEPRWF